MRKTARSEDLERNANPERNTSAEKNTSAVKNTTSVKILQVICVMLFGFCVVITGTGCYLNRCIPEHLNIVVHESEEFDFKLPFGMTLDSDSEEVALQNHTNIPSGKLHLSHRSPYTLYGNQVGKYRLNMRLFGRIAFRDIQVDVVDTQYATPCGIPVGIYLKSHGVMVIGTGSIRTKEGEEKEPAYGVLKTGDYIEAINGRPLRDKEALIKNLNGSNGRETILKVRRDGKEMEIAMNPVRAEDGNYKLGAWVRDDTQGIGTLTYLDMNDHYGALGHGISDGDTGEIMEIEHGELYETQILGIERGTSGNPGVMAGVIFYGPGSELGSISVNSDIGIYGTANERLKKDISGQPVEIGYRQSIHKGSAIIRSSVSGMVEDYDIEIQRIEQNPSQKNKSLIIHVTDPKLLELTGGIIQGMSGSPILQDGRLIGAVTHVFVQDATRGYGILVEDMMAEEKL